MNKGKIFYSVFLLLALQLIVQSLYAQDYTTNTINWNKLNNSHDLSIYRWGPFSKKYAGISHVNNLKSGMRFDFSVFPGLYRYKANIPNVLLQSDYYPWECNNDLTQYTFRHELEWKDDVYADVQYNIIDSSTVLVAIKCVNNTPLHENLDINMVSYVDYPENYPEKQFQASSNVLWKNAVNYQSIKMAQKDVKDNLVYDGWLLCEARNSELLDGRGVSKQFSKDKGNKITYTVHLNQQQLNGKISVLYRIKGNGQTIFNISGLGESNLILKGTGNFEQATFPYSVKKAGSYQLTFESTGGADVDFNGFFIVPEKETGLPEITSLPKNFKPEVAENEEMKNIVLKYKDINSFYGVSWDNPNGRIREYQNDEMDILLRKTYNNHIYKVFSGNGKGNFADVYIRPIELDSHETKTVYALICTGSNEFVKNRLSDLEKLKASLIRKEEAKKVPEVLPEGQKYAFSQQLFKAILMTNILYPIYTQDNYIRHFTPGKFYNSLYTWDAGFIALGMNEINARLAVECINAYTTEEGNPNAFIEHGTPVPVQIYAFFDLWNRTQSKEMLSYFYPRLKKYYEFVAGRYGSSNTRRFKSNILATWSYFYNSGGWDDYPAQVGVHDLKVENTVAPVANTAHSIRLAKMLKMAAEALNVKEDIAKYDNDIKVFSDALQKYSWNEETGYFSYVQHDQNGNPVGKFKDPVSGKDFNMGLDGALPLFSGICTSAQEKSLIERIFSDKRMWTPTGICVVDQSAPYFKSVGYWNGSVWMPQQWFVWKAMLDIGRPDLAKQIADKALTVAKHELDASYASFEYYSAKTGRGAGWHQFGGLSSPLLSWFATYYKPGTATTGFEIWIKEQAFGNDLSSYKGSFTFDKSTSAHPRTIVLCMNPDYKYQANFNGKKISVDSPYPGLLQITLPSTNENGSLTVDRL
jgi:hypothetical protein